MNIVFIPSWYPTDDHPIVGIFVRDQAIAISKHYKDINLGISLWGSHHEDLLLSARKPLELPGKIIRGNQVKSAKHALAENCIEYFHPSFTWSRKFDKGNIQKIIEANLINIKKFESDFGKVQVLHAHIGHPGGYIASVISKILDVPYIITEQMSPFPLPVYLNRKNELNSWLNEAFLHSSCNISVGTDQLKTMKSYGVEKQKFIPNLVDESFFTPGPSTNTSHNFKFFSLGRLEDQKGFDQLLQAFELVLRSYPETELCIGGDGSLKTVLYEQAESLSINNKIKWLGALDRDQALSSFRSCDAFVLSSRHESFGIVLAEAMACGKPIVTTMCGGPRDIFTPLVGLDVQPNNFIELAEKMVQMIEHIEQYDSGSIRSYFEDNFSSKMVSQKIVSVYNQVLSG